MRKYMLYGALALVISSSAGSQRPAAAQQPAIVAESAVVDCDLAALVPGAPLKVDECKALVELYQTLSWVDPRASRDGDEQMNCADLRSELLRAHWPALLDGRFDHSLVAVAHGLAESIHANSRLGRLVQLATAQGCGAEDDDA